MLKLTTLLICLGCMFCIVACISSQQIPEQHNTAFKIIDAKMEKWHSGAPGGNSGSNYFFTIIINTSYPVYFDSVWVKQKAQKLKTVKNGNLLKNQDDIIKGDTLTLQATILKNDPNTYLNKFITNTNKNLSIIKYQINGESKYFVTPELVEIKGPLRP